MSDWLFSHAETSVLLRGADPDFGQLINCAGVADTDLVSNVDTSGDDSAWIMAIVAQIYAGRYDLPGKQLSQRETASMGWVCRRQ